MKTRFQLCTASLVLALGAPAAHALDLTVEVLHAKPAQGTVAGALYDSEASWLREWMQAERQPAADRTVLVYRDVPAGRYALSVYQDENGNGKLDRNLIGMPLERIGFSRDAPARTGPPSFGDAAIDLQADTTITIQLR